MVKSSTILEFDEIGLWSEIKLEIVEKYGNAYTRAFKNYPRLKKYYIDAFSGAGVHLSKTSGERIDGSPVRAMGVYPPFDHFYFVDLDETKTDHLRNLCKDRRDVSIVTGDSNDYLVTMLLPTISFKRFNRALCLFDPYGLHMSWEMMRIAGKSRAVDMFLNFPVMDMNRNAIWHDPEGVPTDGLVRMTRFWGDESWREAAYQPSRQTELFAAPNIEKQSNEAIVEAFRKRLKAEAGFEHVPTPLPMRNSKGAVVYYLFFASANATGGSIVTTIFNKYR